MNYGLDHVSIRRGQNQVLSDYSLTLPKQGVICLLGPSGKGKTTALHLLCRLLTPDAGQVIAPPHGRLGVVFQEDRLLPWLDALENIRLIPDAQGGEALLDALEMIPYAKQRTGRMSGGQRRRVALARALSAPSDLLLLDEPFKGLDDALHQKACELVRQQAANKPCLVVTHDPADAKLLQAQTVTM